MLSGIIVLIVFVLVGVLFFNLVKLYFKYKQNVQSQPNYPFILALGFISIPLINFIIPLDNYIILLINKYTNLNLPEVTKNVMTYMLYIAYMLFVSLILFFYLKFKQSEKQKVTVEKENNKIEFPTDEIFISPHLFERIKELFELKFEKNSLVLNYDSQEKVLIGEYSEAIHSHRFIIYCDEDSNFITKEIQNKTLSKLERINKKCDEQLDTKYFFFIKKGTFEDNQINLKCFIEDDFLNNVIDFKKYLKKNIDLFESSLTDIGKQSILKSFIEPTYNEGKVELSKYLDNWLKEDSTKHISILASYGMGKTTFLKYYSMYLSKKILEEKDIIRYPIFISLTNTSPMSNDGIDIKIQSFVATELGVNYALFQKLVDRGKLVFILDGFDEMGFIGTSKTRFEQFNSIWKLATKNNKILISGRPNYLPTSFERNNVLNLTKKELYATQVLPFTEAITLDKFDIPQIEYTLNVYFDDSNTVEKYLKYIKGNTSILDLCKRPSMLHMTMAILPELYEDNPNKKITSSIIMEKYIEYWISRQESKKINSIFKQNDNNKKVFITDLFIELASRMYLEESYTYSKAKLDNLIDEHLDKIGKVIDINENEHLLEGFKNEIYSGYFIEVDILADKDYFKFVHKSFFEYFVSKKITELISKKNFKNKILNVSWTNEIIDFIDESVESKGKIKKYPNLIQLKNDIVDKYLLIPFTKTITTKNLLFGIIAVYICFFIFAMITGIYDNKSVSKSEINISYFLIVVLGIVLFSYLLSLIIQKMRTKLRFIEKAYYIEFRKLVKNIKITSRQLQHFLDFGKLFRKFENIQFKNYGFNSLNRANFSFISSSLKNISFNKCFIRKVVFSNCQIDELDFTSSSIVKLQINNCNINKLRLENAKMIKKNFKKLIVLEYLIFGNIYKIFGKSSYKIKKEAIYLNQSFINLKDINIENIDSFSIKQIQQFIKNNKLKKKDVIADKYLKKVLFE